MTTVFIIMITFPLSSLLPPAPHLQDRLAFLREKGALGGEEDMPWDIKQTADVEAERAAEEAAKKELEESKDKKKEDETTEDGFAKKPRGTFMTRLLARRQNKDAALDLAFAATEAPAAEAEAAHKAGEAGAKEAAAKPSAAGKANPGKGGGAEQPTPSKLERLAIDADSEFKRIPSNGSLTSGGIQDDDLYPPPPPVGEGDDDDVSVQSSKKDLKHDPSRERRRVAFDVDPRSFQRWKGLGLYDTEAENKTVQLQRASDLSEATKTTAKKEASMQNAGTVSRLGAVHVNVIEAKGLVKTDEFGGSYAFVSVRLFPTEHTSKPDFQEDTPIVYEKDALSKSLKVRWNAQFEISVLNTQSWLECEVLIQENNQPSGAGRLKLAVQDWQKAPGVTTDSWYQLKRADGSLCSAAIHITTRYEQQENDPKQLLLQARAQREAQQAAAEPEIPDWISAWDVRCVRKFSQEIVEARKKINAALDEDTLEALRAGGQLVTEYALMHEANSRDLLDRLKTIEDEVASQTAVRRKISALLMEPRTRIMYLRSAIQSLLSEAHMCGLTDTCQEVKDGLELLKWCTEASQQMTVAKGKT